MTNSRTTNAHRATAWKGSIKRAEVLRQRGWVCIPPTAEALDEPVTLEELGLTQFQYDAIVALLKKP